MFCCVNFKSTFCPLKLQSVKLLLQFKEGRQFFEQVYENSILGRFTFVYLVAKPLIWSETEVNYVVIWQYFDFMD